MGLINTTRITLFKTRDKQPEAIRNEIERLFSIKRIEGVDYIYLDGVRISTKDDSSNTSELLDRLSWLKETLYNDIAKQLGINE